MGIDYGPDTQWPPPEAAAAQQFYAEWLAWWSGDPTALHRVYAGYSRVPAPHIRPSQLNGGASGWISRMWWGNPVMGAAARRMHVPAASDIATISSDMLFSEPPQLKLIDTRQDQGALDDLIEMSQLLSVLAEAAEMSSSVGGVYLRESLNATISPVPITEALLPDNAVPDFYGPFLRQVTFWRSMHDNNGMRHLEHHEMDPARGCVVTHALFVGSEATLGRRVPLTDGDEECKRLATLIDENGEIVVGTSLLDVVYVPNVRPHRLLRGTQLGRSDFSGAESSMDGLDETMTSWMRDIRLGKGRVFVPREYLRRPGGAGEGTTFDPEQEIYQQINAQVPSDGALMLTPVQFLIRVQEHRDTVAAHWRTITSCAGLDTSDHDTEGGPTMTATQVNDRGTRRRATRGKKQSYWTPQLQHIIAVKRELAGAPASPIKVDWPDSAAPDILTLAQTLQMIAAAKAASTQTLVAMLNPEWSTEDVLAEVGRIEQAEAAVEDPGTFSGGGAEPDPQVVDNPVGEDDAGGA